MTVAASKTMAKQCHVQKGGAAIFFARVVGWDGAPITRATISAIKYSIWLLDENNENGETAVAGHTDVTVSTSAVLDGLSDADLRWDTTKHGGGYNFRHALDVTTAPAFSLRGRRYLVRFTLTPVGDGAQPIYLDYVAGVR